MPAIGQNIPHDSAAGHVAGTSVFLDDVRPYHGELLVDFVGSPVAHGRVRAVDTAAARAVAGVALVMTHHDLPGHKQFGPILKDEKLLVEDEAVYIGDPVVLIAADSREALARAKRLVRLEIDPLPALFTIDDAIAAGSFIGPERTIARGDVDAAFDGAQHTLSGTLHIGGQEHFYLESQVAIAHPGEDGQMTVHSSTQHPTEVQQVVAEALGVRFNHVVVICKRMGGGFGGKETQAAMPAAYAALVAARTRRPARFAFSKDDDMRFTGKRHPFQSRWRVAFDSAGRIDALDVQLFSNGGCSCDLSPSVSGAFDASLATTRITCRTPTSPDGCARRTCRATRPSAGSAGRRAWPVDGKYRRGNRGRHLGIDSLRRAPMANLYGIAGAQHHAVRADRTRTTCWPKLLARFARQIVNTTDRQPRESSSFNRHEPPRT